MHTKDHNHIFIQTQLHCPRQRWWCFYTFGDHPTWRSNPHHWLWSAEHKLMSYNGVPSWFITILYGTQNELFQAGSRYPPHKTCSYWGMWGVEGGLKVYALSMPAGFHFNMCINLFMIHWSTCKIYLRRPERWALWMKQSRPPGRCSTLCTPLLVCMESDTQPTGNTQAEVNKHGATETQHWTTLVEWGGNQLQWNIMLRMSLFTYKLSYLPSKFSIYVLFLISDWSWHGWADRCMLLFFFWGGGLHGVTIIGNMHNTLLQPWKLVISMYIFRKNCCICWRKSHVCMLRHPLTILTAVVFFNDV